MAPHQIIVAEFTLSLAAPLGFAFWELARLSRRDGRDRPPIPPLPTPAPKIDALPAERVRTRRVLEDA